MCSKHVCHVLPRKCRQKITKETEKVRKNSLIQKLIIERMIFSKQNYTSKHSSGKDLREYVFNTCLLCLRKKMQTKKSPRTQKK